MNNKTQCRCTLKSILHNNTGSELFVNQLNHAASWKTDIVLRVDLHGYVKTMHVHLYIHYIIMWYVSLTQKPRDQGPTPTVYSY